MRWSSYFGERRSDGATERRRERHTGSFSSPSSLRRSVASSLICLSPPNFESIPEESDLPLAAANPVGGKEGSFSDSMPNPLVSTVPQANRGKFEEIVDSRYAFASHVPLRYSTESTLLPAASDWSSRIAPTWASSW